MAVLWERERGRKMYKTENIESKNAEEQWYQTLDFHTVFVRFIEVNPLALSHGSFSFPLFVQAEQAASTHLTETRKYITARLVDVRVEAVEGK